MTLDDVGMVIDIDLDVPLALWAERRGVIIRPGEESPRGNRVIVVEGAGRDPIAIALSYSPVDERIGVDVLPLDPRGRQKWRSQRVDPARLSSALDRALRRALAATR